jgi:predicted O-methyltransferase YrrM
MKLMSKSLYYKHLEPFKSTEGYWSTTDCVLVAVDILKKTGAKSMLEIGFNIGYSSAIWLDSGIDTLYIIDINNHKDTLPALNSTASFYLNKKIAWLLEDSTSETAKNWYIHPVDIAFIDGGHTYETSLSDSYLSMSKGAKWLVYDDVIENHSNGIWQTITELEAQNKIELICSYPMTWTGQGYVVLAKVLK